MAAYDDLVGLCGIVKISHAVVNGTSLINVDTFAPRERWPELAAKIRESEH
jgi:hypothetical protein